MLVLPQRRYHHAMLAANALQPPQRMTRRSSTSIAPRLGGNHDAQDESRQADRHCTSRSVAFRKVHSRVRHFGGVLVEMVESWLLTTVSDICEKAKQVVSMLSARNWHETIMISRVGVRHMTSILLCKHAQSPIFSRLRRAEGSATLRRSNLCLQSGLTP